MTTEAELMALVAKRFPAPEWAFLRQVRNTTGFKRIERYADGLALNCYPSRGLELHGFEAKSRRSDWLKELRDPDKSCAIQAYCDRWWIVAANEKVVQRVELPPTWGLLVADRRETNLVVAKDAPKLPDPKELDRSFVASVLRSVAKLETSDTLIAKAVNEGIAKGRKMKVQSAKGVDEHWRHKARDLEAAIKENAGKLGSAARLLLNQRHMMLQMLRREKTAVERLRDSYEEAIVELEETEGCCDDVPREGDTPV